jgi:hypothetical protein
MNPRKISTGTYAIFFVALLIFITGTYTENIGFQFAGLLFLLVGFLLAYNQSRNRDDSAG